MLLKFIDDNQTDEYPIATIMEVDVLNTKISIECPLDKAIYKHKSGDEV